MRFNKQNMSDFVDVKELCQYIPLRLTAEERSLLQVLESTLRVSEYTDIVDVSSLRGTSKARKILDGILEICHIATGLATCSSFEASSSNNKSSRSSHKSNGGGKYKAGGAANKLFSVVSNATKTSAASLRKRQDFFQRLFEIGRRNKVLNPSKMRDTYGKLMHMLQDAQSPSVAKSLGFSLFTDLKMVHRFVEDELNCPEFLDDERLMGATAHISANDDSGQPKPRDIVQKELETKRTLHKQLLDDFAINDEQREDLCRVLDSISDAIAVMEQNVAPVARVHRLLVKNFNPQSPTAKKFSLELRGSSLNSTTAKYNTLSYGGSFSSFYNSRYNSREGGPTLSHSHSTQFTFVQQSLQLWIRVQRHMFQLWTCADHDLLSTKCGYQLLNTGQGLHRVQHCPSVAQLMQHLLKETQRRSNSSWVGLSVIHLGDRDVPNALVFIDKYTQVPRILHPICQTVDGLEQLCSDANDGVTKYMEDEFGSIDDLRLSILADFFKHGFDGSGDDGGSCIDGRLTSSWNWTSRVVKKSYYHIFMLSGFQGFDGDFK